MSKYTYTEDMAEISGFGGTYESACRNMVIAGLEWWDEHPNADPKFQGYKNVYGVINDQNKDAKDLSNAVVKACEDCTGAMHQAVISHILRIRHVGWEQYCKESIERAKIK